MTIKSITLENISADELAALLRILRVGECPVPQDPPDPEGPGGDPPKG